MEESVRQQLYKYVEDYLKETEAPLTPEEVLSRMEQVFPIHDDKENIIGMFGINVAQSEYYKEEIPSIRMIYVEPGSRKPTHFKVISKTIFQGLADAGFTRVELSVNRKINNWMRKVLWSKPTLFTHFSTLEDYIGRL